MCGEGFPNRGESLQRRKWETLKKLQITLCGTSGRRRMVKDEVGGIRRGEIMKSLFCPPGKFGLYPNDDGESQKILSGKYHDQL